MYIVYEYGSLFLSLKKEVVVPDGKTRLLAIPGKDLKTASKVDLPKGFEIPWWELGM